MHIAALYHFATVPDPAALVADLDVFCRERGVVGTLICAGEGINGTVAGEAEAIGALLAHLRALPGFEDLEAKRSDWDRPPFGRLRVVQKPEIVTMGRPDADPRQAVGTYVRPEDWNALVGEPGVLLIDTRNDYESAIGTFRDAVLPNTASFRDFPAWVEAHRDALDQASKIAMFCTGGIRCERATAWLRSEGFDEVYHLEGGILRYLEEVPEAESRWQGGCFVFDERVSVVHGVTPGPHVNCRACGRPHLDGTSCPTCAP